MFGYLEEQGKSIIQLIDTPGLLGRSKNNDIEDRAQIVISKFCNEIIFVIDFTENCGFNIESQIKLLKKTSEYGKKITIYLSKTDIFDEEAEEKFEEFKNKIKKFPQCSNSEELNKILIENYKKSLNKFDPKKLNLIK